MNKLKLLFFSSLFVLTACGASPTGFPSEKTDKLDTFVTTSEQEETENVPINNELPHTPIWDEDFDETCLDSIGVVIPYLENKSYHLSVTTDDYGDPLVQAYVYFDSEEELESSADRYATICEADGYQVTYETMRQFDPTTMSYLEFGLYYADIVIDKKTAVELQFLLGADEKGVDCLGIFGFNFLYFDKNSWPSIFVEDLVGEDIPHLEDPLYTYSAWELHDDALGNYVEIVQYGTEYDDEQRYVELFEEKGYTIDDSEADEYGYFAYSEDNSYCVNFYYDINYYYAMTFYIIKNPNII